MAIAKNIRKVLKRQYDAITNERIKHNFLNAVPFWIGSLVTGIIAVCYTKLFAWAGNGTLYIFNHAGWVLFILTPACFVLAWWIVHRWAPYARGSGIPQVTAAIELSNPRHNFVVNKLLSLRVIFIKILSSLVMIFGGGAIGREGPTIQVAASIFKKINDWLPDWYPKVSKRNMIVTGAAAGLASAFNTPLGGIVFAIEELTKTHFNFFKSALLTGVIVAGLTALTLLGPYLYLGYPQTGNIRSWLIIAVIPLALISGVAGSGMGTLMLYLMRRKKALKGVFRTVLYLIGCGLVLAALAYFIDIRVLGSGKEIMETTLFTADKAIPWYVPFLRIIGQVLSFSTGAAGGVFAPSLSAGASIGAVIAGWLHLTGTETNVMILCGMTGFLTGITRSPFTSSILVIEMTNDHNVIFHLMLTALLANLIASVWTRHAFYDHLKENYIHEILMEDTLPASELAKKPNDPFLKEETPIP